MTLNRTRRRHSFYAGLYLGCCSEGIVGTKNVPLSICAWKGSPCKIAKEQCWQLGFCITPNQCCVDRGSDTIETGRGVSTQACESTE